MVQWRMAIAAKKPRSSGKHCKTCRCGVRLERHVCAVCGTRKMEKFMIKTGEQGAFGKERWRCIDRSLCQANVNYGMSS